MPLKCFLSAPSFCAAGKGFLRTLHSFLPQPPPQILFNSARGRGQLTSCIRLLLGEPSMGEGGEEGWPPGLFSCPHSLWATFSSWPGTNLSPVLKWGGGGAPLGSLCSTLSFSPQGLVVLNGLLGGGRGFVGMRGAEANLELGEECTAGCPPPLPPPPSLCPVSAAGQGRGQRAEGCWNEPPEPGWLYYS